MNGRELWVYDGTNPPKMLVDLRTNDSNPSYMTVFNNKMYFQADGEIMGQYVKEYIGIELWVLIP